MEFVGGTTSPVKGIAELEGKFNYLIGKNKNRWTTGVRRFTEARSERVYDGVEVRWYFDRGRPRYDLIVAPGADPSRIGLKFSGADGVRVEGGVLKLQTSIGSVEHRDLVAYQGAERRKVPCSMRLDHGVVRFDVGAYDRARPLVIDPLIYSTFLGGIGGDSGSAVALDSAGRPVVGGSTDGSDFPTTVGAYDRSIDAGSDAFIVKLSADGSRLLWGTFLGGAGNEDLAAVQLNSAGNPVVAGSTGSEDFPTTGDAFDELYNGGIYDLFVSKLSSDGTSLIASTYLGGSDFDELFAFELDGQGRGVFVGQTYSSNFPITIGSGALGGGDGFVTKLSANFGSLICGVYWGGSQLDICTCIDLDAAGRPVVGGLTSSANFPTTVGAFDTSLSGTSAGFVTKFEGDVSSAIWSTLMDGAQSETTYGIGVDPNGNIYASGGTSSTDFPTTVGAYDRTLGGGNDCYVTKLSPEGGLLASTYLGGDNFEFTYALGLRSGGVVIHADCGPAPPTTNDSFDPGGTGTSISLLNGALTDLRYATTFNGSFSGLPAGMAMTSGGDAIVVGFASDDIDISGHGFDDVLEGGEGYVARFTFDPIQLRIAPRRVIGGIDGAAGKIVLPAPANPGGVVVTLTSSSVKVGVPDTVVVPAGSKIAMFPVKTHSVAEDTGCMVTAFLPGGEQSLLMRLAPGGLISLQLSKNTVTGGRTLPAKVLLSAPAPPGGFIVSLSSSHPSVIVPSSVPVPEGAKEAAFTIQTSAVGKRREVTVSAKLGSDAIPVQLVVNP